MNEVLCVSSTDVDSPILKINSKSLGAKNCFCPIPFYPCMASTAQINEKSFDKIVDIDCKSDFYLKKNQQGQDCDQILVCTDKNKPEWYTKDHLIFLCNLIKQRYMPIFATNIYSSLFSNNNQQPFTKTKKTQSTIGNNLASVSVVQCKEYNKEENIPFIPLPQTLEKVINYKNNNTIKNCMSDLVLERNLTSQDNSTDDLETFLFLVAGLGIGSSLIFIICLCCFLSCLKQILCCYCCCSS